MKTIMLWLRICDQFSVQLKVTYLYIKLALFSNMWVVALQEYSYIDRSSKYNDRLLN